MFSNKALKFTKLPNNIRKISNEASYYIPFMSRPTFKISETDFGKDVIKHPLFKEASDSDKREILRNLKLAMTKDEPQYTRVLFEGKKYSKNVNTKHLLLGNLVRSGFYEGVIRIGAPFMAGGFAELFGTNMPVFTIFYNVVMLYGVAYEGVYIFDIKTKFGNLKRDNEIKKFNTDIEETLKKLS